MRRQRQQQQISRLLQDYLRPVDKALARHVCRAWSRFVDPAPRGAWIAEDSVRDDAVRVVAWLHDHGYGVYPSSVAPLAAAHGAGRCFDWCLETDEGAVALGICDLEERATAGGHLHILQKIYTAEDTQGDDLNGVMAEIGAMAAAYGHAHIVKWTQECRGKRQKTK